MKTILLLSGLMACICACNNQGTGSENADSSNLRSENTREGHSDTTNSTADTTSQKSTTSSPVATTDSAASRFLKKAADGGLAEVKAGELATHKGIDPGVRRFAAMMVNDHTGANAQVKSLSEARNIPLPAEPSAEHKKKADELEKKNNGAFDKAYMDLMVEDHTKTIALFQRAEKESSDQEVKAFITATLPKLQMHLDSAKAVRNKLHR